ncbi:MAG: iron uptake porin [Cyanobacteria bacterium P01_F01_bin.150]
MGLVIASLTWFRVDGAIAIGLDAMVQVTPVFELSESQPDPASPDLEGVLRHDLRDVYPSDWAYEALESLIHRYNIPLGFPDGTYRGDRPLTRYELAAVMIPVLDQLQASILEEQRQLIQQESDIEIIEQLQNDFQKILAESKERLVDLELRTDTLEEQTFSTTTLLNGEGLLALTEQGGDGKATQTTGQYRVWLDFSTHFSARDALNTRLIMSNSNALGQNDSAVSTAGTTAHIRLAETAEGTLIQNSRGNSQDRVELDWLAYSRSFGDRSTLPINLYISAKGGTHSHYVDTLSPFGNGFQGDGAISVFGQTSPIYTIGGGAGIGGEWVLNKDETLSLAVGYLADQAAADDAGLFNRDYAALGQLTLRPTSNVQLGLTYVHGYHSPESAIFDSGLEKAIAGTGIANGTHSFLDTPAITHSYGVQTTVELNNRFSLYGFGGYTDVRFIDKGDGDLWFYGMGLGIENWLIPQTSGGLIVGSEPYLAGFNHSSLNIDNDTPLHVEAFYTLRLSDQVSVSPGLLWLTAPNQNQDNRDRVIATLRTTFKF